MDNGHALGGVAHRPSAGGVQGAGEFRSGRAADLKRVGMPQRRPAGSLIAQDVVHEVSQLRAEQRLTLRRRPISPDGVVHSADLQHGCRLEGLPAEVLPGLGAVIRKDAIGSGQGNGEMSKSSASSPEGKSSPKEAAMFWTLSAPICARTLCAGGR